MQTVYMQLETLAASYCFVIWTCTESQRFKVVGPAQKMDSHVDGAHHKGKAPGTFNHFETKRFDGSVVILVDSKSVMRALPLPGMKLLQ